MPVFETKDLLKALKRARLAVHTQDFIPIHSCFCFEGKKWVYGYNNMVAVRTQLNMATEFAVEADVLYKMLSSLSAKEVTLETSDKALELQTKGTKVQVPILGPEDFQLKWPKISDGGQNYVFTAQTLKTFIHGLKLCMSSIGDGAHTPAQMGVTVTASGKGELILQSTTNRSISNFISEKGWGGLKMNQLIFPTGFCKALMDLIADAGDEAGVKMLVSQKSVVFDMGKTQILGKLISNPNPLNFEKAIEAHMGGSKKQEFPKKMGPIFDRCEIILAPELRKFVKVKEDGNKLSFEATGRLGTVKDSVKSKEAWGSKPREYWTDTQLVQAALATEPQELVLTDRAMGFASPGYLHLIATATQNPN